MTSSSDRAQDRPPSDRPRGTASSPAGDDPRLRPLREQLQEAARQIEARIILEALQQYRWNRRRTAQALQISYRSLMYKMKRCNLRDGDTNTSEAL